MLEISVNEGGKEAREVGPNTQEQRQALRLAIQKAKSEIARLLVEYTEEGDGGMTPAEKKVLAVHFRKLTTQTVQ